MTISNMDHEAAAITSLKKGDISGLEWLVYRYQGKALQAAFLIVQDEQLAEDIVQDAFLQVYRGIGTFDISRPFKPWFLQIVFHCAVKTIHDGQKSVSFLEDLDQFLQAVEPSLDDQLDDTEKRERIRDALKVLSPSQRMAIVRYYFLEMDGKQVAESMGNSVGTVKWLLSKAREKLAGLLDGKV